MKGYKFMIHLVISLLMTTLPSRPGQLNVLDTPIEPCCSDPMTGFYRDGSCHTGPRDYGVHTVCAVMTEEFLDYTSSCGNDLSTPNSQFHFPGLKPGDKWCLCAERWRESLAAGVAPPIILESTHKKTLEYVSLDVLKNHNYNPSE